MRLFGAFLLLLAVFRAPAQCPFPSNLASSGECPGSLLTVGSQDPLSKIIWYKDGLPLSTVTAVPAYGNGITVAGGNGGGSATFQLDFPAGIFVDAAGDCYVCDDNNNRVMKWAPGATSGVLVAGGNGLGSAANQLSGPASVFVDAAGNIYVSDYTNFRVQKWAPGAASGVTVAGGNGGGSGAGQFDFPVGIFVDAAGNLYVADDNNNRIQKWAPGATSGVVVAGGNGPGSGANQLYAPEGLFVDAAGNIYIADDFNHRVQKWAPGATSGVTVAGGNGQGSGANQLSYPYGVFVDPSGNVFVCDADNNRVQEWAPGATSGMTVAGGNGPGPGSNQLNTPRSAWVDSKGTLYVSEETGGRVQAFLLQSSIVKTYPAAAPGVYTAVVTNAGGCTVTTNPVTIHGPVTTTVSISASANPVDGCSLVSFTAKTTGEGHSPYYQWQVNGSTVATTIGPVYAPGNLADGSVVTCVLTSSDACTVNTPVTSNGIVMTVRAQPAITVSLKHGSCPGDTLVVNSTDSLAQIVWNFNGNAVATVKGVLPRSGITVAGGNGIGDGANQFSGPRSVFVDAAGNIYVADYSNNRVQKWAPGATSGVTVAGNGRVGDGPGQLNYPAAIFVDPAGNIYIADAENNRVQKWAPGAASGVTVAGGNGAGSAANQLNWPAAVFVDAAGNLFVGDFKNDRVQKFAPGATSGVTVAGGNGIGFSDIQCAPVGLFVDAAGNLYVSDVSNGRVQEWTPGATKGITVAGGGCSGPPNNCINMTAGLWVDAAGNIYVPEGDRIQRWTPGATDGVTVAGQNGIGDAPNQIYNASGIYIDAAGNMYIADFGNNRIQEWGPRPKIDTAYKALSGGSYTADVITSGGCTLRTNAVVIDPAVTPSVVVGASSPAVCTGSPATFTATPTNGGLSPAYQWQVDGVNAGTNSNVFTSSGLTDGAQITCTLTGDAGCSVTPTAVSGPLVITISPIIDPSVSIQAKTATICAGSTASFTATPVNGGSSPVYQWAVNGSPAGGNSAGFSTNLLADGDLVSCQLTSNAACLSTPTVYSNTITMAVTTTVPPTVNIDAADNPVCAGVPVKFTASTTHGGANPVYQWQVNGGHTGTNSPVYTSGSLHDGDQVSCLFSSDASCAAASSNPISMSIYPLPVIAPGQVFTSTPEGVILHPAISGNILDYLWTPATDLSADDIADPFASPTVTTTYHLLVHSTDGCQAEGDITVKVFREVRIPSAFTPNGDGHNDIFYVLGAPQGSVITNLSVFDRWGVMVFQVHNAIPGDPTFGWNGTYKGLIAPVATYVYTLTIKMADGRQVLYKGPVVLAR